MREIALLLRDGSNENQGYWSSEYRAEFRQKAQEIGDTVEQMKRLQSDDPDAAEDKEVLRNRIRDEYLNYVLNTVKPRLVDKRIREAVESARPTTEAELQRQRELAEHGDALQARIDELENALSGLEPLIETRRAEAAQESSEELSHEYGRQAKEHHDAWKLWLIVLILVGVTAIAAGIALLIWNRPTGDDIDGEAIARLTIDIYVIGLLLYAVRVASLQFRVHRHLEAKARSKAAALSTFSRFVASGADQSTRDVVAQTLAQAVFESGDTGFVDSGSDQITLIERVIGPATQRLSGS